MDSNAISLFRAEWQKITGNRIATLLLIWIFPITAAFSAVMMCVLVLISPEARALFRSGALVVELWNRLVPEIWNLPNSWLGRMLLVGFAAFVFAGEYQWRTWKNIVPRSRRIALILTKFVVIGALVALAFLSALAILSLGTGLAIGLAGGKLTSLPVDRLAGLAADSALLAVVTLLSTTIAAGFAALAGIGTHSILGGVLIGLGATGGEQFLLMALGQVAIWLNNLRLLELIRFTSTYNVANLMSWISDGSSTTMLFGLASDSLAFSLVVLAAWVLALIAMAVVLFQRQDIDT
jgi:ABC-type transport system involved in multi-copper enzyme maturation permease subunit